MCLTVKDIREYLGLALGTTVEDERIELFLKEALETIPSPCNCNPKTVSYYILNQLFDLGEITNSPNDKTGIKKESSGEESIEYNVESSASPTRTSSYYKGLYTNALTECLANNKKAGAFGNIFIE